MSHGVTFMVYHYLLGLIFTMSLFVTTVAFDNETILVAARYAIVTGSLITGTSGLLGLFRAQYLKKEIFR